MHNKNQATGAAITDSLLVIKAQAYADSTARSNAAKDTSLKRYVPHFTKYIFDTATEVLPRNDSAARFPNYKIKRWSHLQSCYIVCCLAPNTYCLCFDAAGDSTSNVVNSLMYKAGAYSVPGYLNGKYMLDSVATYPLNINNKFNTLMMHNDTTRVFYVYCMRGRTTARINRFLYCAGPCVSFMAAQLAYIDTAKYGMPLVASQLKIDLTYGTIPDFQRDLDIYMKYNFGMHGDDYTWSSAGTPHIFAYNDTLFFTYNDSFKYYHDDNDTSKGFPDRMLFKKMGDNKIWLWYDPYVDFFGIPCD